MNLEDLLGGVLDAVKRRARFHGFYLYEVASDDGARATLRRVGDVSGLPDELPITEKRYGSHGLSCQSAPGQQVLVGFEGGDPGRPFVAHYIPADPKTLTVDAVDVIQIGETIDRPSLRIHVGSTGRKPVSRRGDTVACGALEVVGAAGAASIVYTNQAGAILPLGSLAVAGGVLVWTPDPTTAGRVNITGEIMSGSTLFDSE